MASLAPTPLSFSLLPEKDQIDSQTDTLPGGRSECLILYGQGTLALFDIRSGSQMIISRSVEQFWNLATSHSTPSIGDALWTYGNSGLQLWFPFNHKKKRRKYSHEDRSNGVARRGSSEESLKNLLRYVSVPLDEDVYPVGFLANLGIVVALSRSLSYSSCCPFPSLEMLTKVHPFLQWILEYMFESEESDYYTELEGEQGETVLSKEMYNIAIKHRHGHIPHFSHSLELLLHGVLQKIMKNEKKRKQNNKNKTHKPKSMTTMEIHKATNLFGDYFSSSGSWELNRVIQFIGKFPEFLVIVVQCARKMEPAVWDRLFNFCGGDCVVLFEHCILVGQLHAAASYLQIIRYMDGERVSNNCAFSLLECALESGDLSLVRDLMRFVERTSPLLVQGPEFPSKKQKGKGKEKEQREQVKAQLQHSTGSGWGWGWMERESKPLDDPPNEPQSLTHSQDDSDDEIIDRKHKKEMVAINVLLRRHASKLLASKTLLVLLHFSAAVSRPLRPWLTAEQNRAAVLNGSSELSAALQALHTQFYLPYPNYIPKSRLKFLTSLTENDKSKAPPQHTSPNCRGSGPGAPKRHSISEEKENENSEESDLDSWIWLSDDTDTDEPSTFASLVSDSCKASFSDLDFLSREMLEAECYDWALVINTILLRTSVIINLLQQRPETKESYFEMLSQQTRGYLQLLSYLKEIDF
eukprot:CAMPEP_0174271912 /NCGR_PEP_ID=MMETSP0439-20130205/49427_1 /TAXON_ID=0 /ORGANISM="Stereomyxa ramosa, Strain Chinc5" /LENGTH=694 /DNA_ID=CAMNT_0015362183 /DNA_START=1807 /DNA_END=3891 /DNA_ORIENTATION=+